MEKKIITELVKALKKDEGLYLAWQANIAMAFVDEVARREFAIKVDMNSVRDIANQATKNFLNSLIKK